MKKRERIINGCLACMVMILIACFMQACTSNKSQSYKPAPVDEQEQIVLEQQIHDETVERHKMDFELEVNHELVDYEYAGNGVEIIITRDTVTGKFYKW